jgi:transposase-like protein
MPKRKEREFSREFKLAALRRMEAGENVSGLARELKLRRKVLYAWRDTFRASGPEGLRGRGRPSKAVASSLRVLSAAPVGEGEQLAAAQRRIAELERKVGQQQLELDFFRQALRQVEGQRRAKAGPGATASTRASKR